MSYEKQKVTSLIIICSMLLNGCATRGRTVGLGGAIGAGTGAGIGAIVDPGKDGEYRTRNVIIGTALGGAFGLVASDLIHDKIESEKQNSYREGKKSAPKESDNPPTLRNPKVEAKWIEGRIVGSRYVEGHFEYVITEPARWEEDSK